MIIALNYCKKIGISWCFQLFSFAFDSGPIPPHKLTTVWNGSKPVLTHCLWCPRYRQVTWTHASFCRELIVLPGACIWSLDTYFNLSPIYHLYVCQNFIPSKILSSNIISCNLIYNANGIFKLWEFYCSCPSARNKQSVHIASIPPGRTHSRLSAGRTTISQARSMMSMCFTKF